MTRPWFVPLVVATAAFLAGGLAWITALVSEAIWVVIALALVWVLRHELAVRRLRSELALHLDKPRTAVGTRDG